MIGPQRGKQGIVGHGKEALWGERGGFSGKREGYGGIYESPCELHGLHQGPPTGFVLLQVNWGRGGCGSEWGEATSYPNQQQVSWGEGFTEGGRGGAGGHYR